MRLIEHWACTSACFSALTVGLNFGWSSHALPKLQSNSSAIPVTSSEGSWIISTGLFAGLIAFPVFALLLNTIGRKWSILLTALPHLLGWLLMLCADDITWVYASKTFHGLGDAGVLITVPFYIAEVASTDIRGRLSALFAIMFNLGSLLSYSIGPYLEFTSFPIVGLVVVAVFVATFSFMPESPYFHLTKKKYAAARDSLKVLRGTDNVDEEVKRINHSVTEMFHGRNTLAALLHVRSNRKALLIVLAMVTFEQWSGITAILFYCQQMFADANVPIPPHISAIIFAAVFLLGAFGTSLAVDRLGRRTLGLISCSCCAVCLCAQGTYFFLKDVIAVDVTSVSWLPIVVMIPYVLFAVFGLVNLPMILMGELFPANLQALGSIIFGMYMSLIIISVTKFYQFTKDTVGDYVPFFCFAGNCVLGIIFIFFYMPETKNKTLQEIQRELRGEHSKQTFECTPMCSPIGINTSAA